ncbi:proteoglycan 4 isoform X3 [Mastacembelus armatus]|uniref:proteoglycan 4 isoform X3 n=1 Tax=Mastacembelus armatus TaxID=205130 RepID=UPI000E45E538|nr:proteoglycan 4-like isoform X3 [Mastacembelus armatus]
MDQQEGPVDFKALMAKFQDEELHLKQPKHKPVLREKPKVVSPPQSPSHYLPAGARPSLLSSINQSLDTKTMTVPRVVFKDEKESKMPLIQPNSKGKGKSEEKLKVGKDKSRNGSKEKLDASLGWKQKKENSKDKKLPLVLPIVQNESTAELVPATPPPKATTPKKKGFLGLKKSTKRDSMEVLADPILDTPSLDLSGQAPLIPVPPDFGDSPSEPEISIPKALLPNSLSSQSSVIVESIPTSVIPASPNVTLPPAFIPSTPTPKVPTPENEPPLKIETPALPISRPANQNEINLNTPSTDPTHPTTHAISSPLPVAYTRSPPPPEPEVAAEAGIEAVNIAAVQKPPSPVIDPPSTLSSPKARGPISALSVLERVEDKSPGKKTSPADHRVFSALEKARRKTTSSLTNPTTPPSFTPPPEEFPIPQSPTHSFMEFPPIDYEDKARNTYPPKPAQVNGIDHYGITDEGPDAVPELLMVPPPPPKKLLNDPESLGPAQEKTARLPSINLNEFIPPPVIDDAPEILEANAPKFDDVASNAHSPQLLKAERGNGEYTGPDTVDGQNLPDFYNNGANTPGTAVHAAPAHGDEYQYKFFQEFPPPAGPIAEVGNGEYRNRDNIYEEISAASKKKGKTDGGKKRKGAPKNPYKEAAQETTEEKTKTGRFGKSDKKAIAEGPDDKELKKKEKQRLEKEKKELKEKKEKEKKEQKERGKRNEKKKENEMMKKFNITGQEDAIYQAKATVTTKGRKNDLPLRSGDVISIIRTNNCPKGKWLAKDSSNNYGYVAVDHVELDIKEMMEMGKKATISHKTTNQAYEGEVTSTGSRASNGYPLSTGSFTDDSEEWTGDEDDPLSPAPETVNPLAPVGHNRTISMPDMGNKDLSISHQHSRSDIHTDGAHIQARHEALQKLATFFRSPKPVEPAASTEPQTSPVHVQEAAVHPPQASSTQEMDFDHPDMLILPPPDLYADLTME